MTVITGQPATDAAPLILVDDCRGLDRDQRRPVPPCSRVTLRARFGAGVGRGGTCCGLLFAEVDGGRIERLSAGRAASIRELEPTEAVLLWRP
jgi:hypothetical protein